jgi:hypothetical protein
VRIALGLVCLLARLRRYCDVVLFNEQSEEIAADTADHSRNVDYRNAGIYVPSNWDGQTSRFEKPQPAASTANQ